MRDNSQSIKVSKWLSKHLESLDAESEIIDLNLQRLPLYDGDDSSPASEILAKLESAEGFVFVSPEWNGTMSHGLLNMLMFVDDELAHKPVMLAGVSSGRGGHYPLMQMRNMVYKNSRFVVSPENLLVQGAIDTMNNYEFKEAYEHPVEKRADYALKILIEYAKALATVRSGGMVDSANFPSGV